MEDNKKRSKTAAAVYTFCGLLIAGYAGTYVWLGYLGLPSSTLLLARAVMYLAIPGLLAFTALIAWARSGPGYRWQMFFLTAASTLTLAGEVIWFVQTMAKGGVEPAHPGPADFLILGGYVFFFGLLSSMARRRNPFSGPRLRYTIDAQLLTLLAAMVVWFFDIRYVVMTGAGSAFDLGHYAIVFAPVVNLTFVFAIAANVAGFKRDYWRTWEVCTAIGLSFITAANILLASLVARHIYTAANPWKTVVDAGFIAAYFWLFVGGASFLLSHDKKPHPYDEAREPRRTTIFREALVYVSMIGTVSFFIPLALESNPKAYDAWAILAFSTLLILLTMIRAFITVADNNKMISISLTDPLTGINNYKYFLTRLDAELARAKRYNENLAIALIDINAFSKTNRARGQVMGDAILRSFSKVLRKYSRLSDSVCRIGGDEFAMILPHTQGIEATVVCERIKQKLNDEHHSALSVFLSGFSAGISSFPAHGEDRESLILKADSALRHAMVATDEKIIVFEDVMVTGHNGSTGHRLARQAPAEDVQQEQAPAEDA